MPAPADDTPAARLDAAFTALADPTRRAVIELLRKKPRRAGELADELETTRPAMSRHLRLLRKSGLVSETDVEHDARVRLYSLEREPFLALRGWLDEVEAFWTAQLGSFKAHLERRGRKRGAR
jgi:DNA-binding transcriptional ArsR family regulator